MSNPAGPEKPTIYCRQCRYALDGLPGNRCPECGTPFQVGDRSTVVLGESGLRRANTHRVARRIIGSLAIVIGLGVVALMTPVVWLFSSGSPFVSETITTRVNPEQLDRAAKEMRLQFPPSTRALGYAEWASIDYMLLLKIEIDRKDLPSLLAPLGGLGGLDSTRMGVSGNQSVRWWDVDQFTKYEGVAGQTAFGSTSASWTGMADLKVLVDLRGSSKVVVYLDFSRD